MANEYGEIEQLVNDVTSLDTARMTLRWALERLNSIEKEKAELKKSLTLAEETARGLQAKDASLREVYETRGRTLGEKENFYTKLETTMQLLGEGKLNIQQLLKKEAKLDSLRLSLENEYQEKFAELDHNQRGVIERWSARLLETESQYAGRLAEAQKKYDALRAELETEHQGRLNALQEAFRGKEAALSARIAALEAGAGEKDARTEARRGELETQYLLQKREAEDNYRKLKNLLEAGLEDKLRAMDCDHAAQVNSLERSWQIERARLLDEQRVRDVQFRDAQARIKELENGLAAQQEAHHGELLKLITEKETAFRAQLLALEREKAAKEQNVRELMARLAEKSAGWEGERARLEAEYGGRLAAVEAAARERAAELERGYAGKKEELRAELAAGRENFERELQFRLETERRALAGEKAALAAAKALREAALAEAGKQICGLEAALAAASEAHRKELMAQINAGETGFREKLAGFESEKAAYNQKINDLADDLRAREAALLEEKGRLASEFEAKAAACEDHVRRSEAAFDAERRAYNTKISELTARVNEASKAALLDRENLKSEIARVAAETQTLAEKRLAILRVDFDTRKVELEREFVARYGDRLRAMEAEKARVNEALAERELLLKEAYEKAAGLDAEMAGLRKTATDEKHALALEYDGKLRAAVKAAAEETGSREARMNAEIGALRGEREKLSAALAEAGEAARAGSEERAEAVRREYEARLAGLKETIARKETQLERAAAEGRAAEKALRESFEQERGVWMLERAAACAAAERRAAELEAGLAARAAALDADFNARKERLEAELRARADAAAGGAAADVEFERKNWHAERARQEKMLAEASGNFIKAQKEIAELGAALEGAAEESSTNEDRFINRLKEVKAAHARDLDRSVAEAVSERTAPLIAALEAARAKNDELAAAAAERGDAVRVLRAEAAEMRREFEESLRLAAENLALKEDLARLRAAGEEAGHIAAGLAEERFAAEKERLLAELARRDKYVETADLKIRQMELDIIKYRQNASGELLAQIAEQEERYREVVREQRQLEMDGLRAEFDKKVNRFNEELLAQKQALADREKAVNDYRQALEKDYAAKAAEAEKLKAELSRAIKENRGGK